MKKISRSNRKEACTRECTICERSFEAATRFIRFCPFCRRRSEVLRFAPWLPEARVLV
jgi:endogenous inhibitor of DNA gyrase (YacG/DUF329 family)